MSEIYKPFKESKPKSDTQTIEELLLQGKKVDSDMVMDSYEITNLPVIISRLKKKYPALKSDATKIGKKGKSIKVYTLPFML